MWRILLSSQIFLDLNTSNLRVFLDCLKSARVQAGQTSSGGQSSVTKELGSGRLSMARTVLRSSPELAQEVVNGGLSLDAAYESVLSS